MPSLVATTYALARKTCVSTHYVRTNNAKFSGHYVCPCTETVRAHALRSHQNLWCTSCKLFPETQSHLLQCPVLVQKLKYLAGKTSKLNEKYVYGNINQQEINVNIFSDLLEVRESLKENLFKVEEK